MFTGIVQGMGTVTAVEETAPDFRRHCVELPPEMADNLQTGASVAHNGCCLTISAVEGRTARFDLMAETLAQTNLGSLKAGNRVNLERAAKFGDEIGGHVMSGHILTQTEILRIERQGLNRTLWFALPPKLIPYVLPKGFIGLDGCSLTIGSVENGRFCVHLIPETLNRTLFGSRREGDRINVEIDAQTQAIVDTAERILTARFPTAHS